VYEKAEACNLDKRYRSRRPVRGPLSRFYPAHRFSFPFTIIPSMTIVSEDSFYKEPPFPPDVQLNCESLSCSLIPGEYTPIEDSSRFLKMSLSQAKANEIFGHLWFAGTPGRFRAFHEEYVFRRNIIPCEDPNLHLVWFSDAIYSKPLPPCITNYEFFKERICPDKTLFSLACGLLFSYTNLVRHESDFRIAVRLGLLRSNYDHDLTWERWQAFRMVLKPFFASHPASYDKRYKYGELRLTRLNFVYALKLRYLQGYHNVYTQYGPYFSRYFAGAILIFAFASVSLGAMQVMLQAPPPNLSPTLVTTTYRFSVAILVSVVSIVFFIGAIFVPIVTYDLWTGVIGNKRLAKEIRRSRQP
jgi:hypothetical protein